MTTYDGPEGAAVTTALQEEVPSVRINPALRIAGGAEPLGGSGDEIPEDAKSLLVRHATSPAVIVLAVTDEDGTHRVRIGVDLEHPTLESGSAGGPADRSRWQNAQPAELLDALVAALPRDEVFTAPPQLTQERGAGEAPDGETARDEGAASAAGAPLRLTAQEAEQARRLRDEGHAPEDAVGHLGTIDPRLRDALLARGPRVSLSMVLHDADHRVISASVPWARVWVLGDLGLYRTDPEPDSRLTVLPVEPGDVLGTMIGILQEAMRFTAAVRAGEAQAGGAR